MNQEEEKLLDDLEKELASVDTHYLFAMGPGGTVFPKKPTKTNWKPLSK